jgi:hypothetical protein
MERQIVHVLIDRRQSNILDVQSLRGTDYDNDHCLVVARCRERLLVSKRATQKFDIQRFYLKKLNDAEVKEQYQVKISVMIMWTSFSERK